MKKNDAITEGRTDGTAAAQCYLKTTPGALDYGTDNDQRETVQAAAVARRVECAEMRKIASTFYADAFVSAFMAEWRRQYEAQPEAVSSRRRRRVVEKLDYLEQAAKREVAKFTAVLAENPAYAFEWGDKAAQSAAVLGVTATVRTWIAYADEHGQDAVELVAAELQREVLRGARFPSHSTSELTNVMAIYKLAAFAELLETAQR